MNWGNKIVIVFTVFVTGMIVMVVKAFQEEQQMVTSNYYEKELVYQQKIDAMKNLALLNDSVVVHQAQNVLVVKLPEAMHVKQVNAMVHLYCPFNEANDQHVQLTTNNGSLSMPLNNVQVGNYVVKTEWNDGEKMFYSENKIIIK